MRPLFVIATCALIAAAASLYRDTSIDAKAAVPASIDNKRAEFAETLERILREQQAADERSDKIVSTLDAVQERLTKIEAELQTIKAGPVIEPPAAPVVKTQPAGVSEGNRILSQYSGQPWYVVGHRGNTTRLRRHLGEHGLPTDGLETFSNAQLERIHGAAHTQHHSASMYARDPSDPRFARVRTSSQAVRTYPVRIMNGARNCPNGRCVLPRRR